MSTRIINVTGGAASLPPPYRGVLGPGKGTVLSDEQATVISRIGGADNVIGMFRLEMTSEPGVPANDPPIAAPLPGYTNASRPAAGAVGATATQAVEIFNNDDNAPNYSDGTNWRDGDGNLT